MFGNSDEYVKYDFSLFNDFPLTNFNCITCCRKYIRLFKDDFKSDFVRCIGRWHFLFAENFVKSTGALLIPTQAKPKKASFTSLHLPSRVRQNRIRTKRNEAGERNRMKQKEKKRKRFIFAHSSQPEHHRFPSQQC